MNARWPQAVGWLFGAGAACSLALACGQADDFGAAAPTTQNEGGAGGGQVNIDGGVVLVDGSTDDPVDRPPDANDDQYLQGSRFQAVPVTYLVHAAPELFDFRVCVKSGESFVNDLPFPSDSDHFLPASNYPGVPRGGVVEFDDSLLGSEEQVTLYLVPADNDFVKDMQPALNPKHGCASLDGLDSVTVSLATSALIQQSVRAIVIDTSIGGEAKLVGFSPELDMEPSTTKVAAFHSSPFLDALQTQGHAFELSYGKLDDDANRTSIAANLEFDRPPTTPQDVTPPSALELFSDFGFVITQTHDATTLFPLRASLADVQRLSSPYETPQDFYAQSNGLLLLALGDVDGSEAPPWLLSDGTWNPAYNGSGLHLLALRFTFALE